MKFLIALFAFGAAVIGVLVAVLYEEGNMQYSDRLEVIQNNDCVVVLHGLKMSPRHLSFMARSLEKEGYDVYNIGYDSDAETIENIARNQVRSQMPQTCEGRLHFVGHSMGGIIIRELLKQDTPGNIGRIVMLGTPNQGSEMVDFLMETPVISTIFDLMFGPAAEELRTKNNTYLEELPAPVVQTGIIAGDNYIEPIGGMFVLPAPNDGKVSVKSAKLPTMTDFVLLHDSHFWLPISHEARMQTLHFLKNGKFK